MTGLEILRGCVAGEPMVVFGDGPSFRSRYREVWLGGVRSIGCNRTAERHRSEFLVCLEAETDVDLWQTVRGIGSTVITLARTARGGDLVLPSLKPAEWPETNLPELGLPDCSMSPWWAAALAVYCGATRVGVLGVDLHSHPIHGRPAELELADWDWRRLSDHAARVGCLIVNLSGESALKSLPVSSAREFLAP